MAIACAEFLSRSERTTLLRRIVHAGRLLAVAIMRKEGGTDLNPSPTAMLMPGEALVVMKRALRK